MCNMLQALQEVVASNGNIRLAAERSGVSIPQLMRELLEQPTDEIQKAVNLSVQLQLLDLICMYKVALIASMDDMTGRDLSNGFAKMLELLFAANAEQQQGAASVQQLFNFAGSDNELPIEVRLDTASHKAIV